MLPHVVGRRDVRWLHFEGMKADARSDCSPNVHHVTEGPHAHRAYHQQRALPHPQSPHQAIQITRVYSEQLGRSGVIVPRLLKRLGDSLALGAIDGVLQPRGPSHFGGLGNLPDALGQVFQLNDVARSEHGRAALAGSGVDELIQQEEEDSVGRVLHSLLPTASPLTALIPATLRPSDS